MRICLLLYRSLPASPNSAAFKRIERLGSAHRVTVITTKDAEIPVALARLVRVKRVPIKWQRRGGDSSYAVGMIVFLAAATLTLLGGRRRFDVVYTFHTPEILVGWLQRRLFRLPWVVDALDLPHLNVADQEFLSTRRRHHARARQALFLALGRAMTSADLVITPAVGKNEGTARVLRREFGIAADRLLPVPNGVDLELIEPAARMVENGSGFLVVYVGFVSPRRGVDTLLEASRIAARSVPGLRVALAGPFKDEDRAALAALHTTDLTVEFLGPLPHDEVLGLIRSADVCVYPFPRRVELDGVLAIKVLEYLACARAVVATNLSGASAIVKHEYNGLLVPPSDPAAMAEGIQRLYSDIELRRRLQANARDSVEPFRWEGILDQVEMAMTNVVGKK